jgi:GT2 family glycosyltransferase
MIPDIAYMILNYNPDGEEGAKSILETVIDTFYSRKSKHLRSDVYLLDQGTTSDHRRWLVDMQEHYGFSTILLNRNVGISRAINLFVRTCKSPVIGLITSDVLVTSGMDEDLFEKAQIPDVYQATPFTDKSDVDYQRWQPAEEFGADRIDLTGLKARKPFLDILLGRPAPDYLRAIGVELNVMFWRRNIFDKIGYFDERWKACYENNDFSLRCFLSGGCTAISKDSFVWHYHKVTEKNNARDKSHEGYIEECWPEAIRKLWDAKWPDLDSEINIYRLLKNRTISDYPGLLRRFEKNIYLPYEQDIAYE